MNLVANRINFIRGAECAQTTTVYLFMFVVDCALPHACQFLLSIVIVS